MLFRSRGARPSSREDAPLVLGSPDPKPRVAEEPGGSLLRLNLPDLRKAAARRVTTELLGKARVSGLAYENADGSPVAIDSDYFGVKRNAEAPYPGPFENPGRGKITLKVWGR